MAEDTKKARTILVKDFSVYSGLPNEAGMAIYRVARSTSGREPLLYPKPPMCELNAAASLRVLARLIFVHQIYAGAFRLLFADAACRKCNQVNLFLSCPDALHHFVREINNSHYVQSEPAA